jgi:hypothetical protein
LGTLLGIISTLYKCIIFLPFACPPFLDKLSPAIKWLIFREPEKMFEPPDAQKTNAIVKNEFWIFVNGVATTSEIAFANQNELYKMFSRPITLCHNPTDGVVFDLLECAAGKVRLVLGARSSIYASGGGSQGSVRRAEEIHPSRVDLPFTGHDYHF